MKERNKYFELDGLAFETESHEFFHDKSNTSYAQNGNIQLKNIFCFITREKETGKYTRVIVDNNIQQVIYESGDIEEIGCYIDELKLLHAAGLGLED